MTRAGLLPRPVSQDDLGDRACAVHLQTSSFDHLRDDDISSWNDQLNWKDGLHWLHAVHRWLPVPLAEILDNMWSLRTHSVELEQLFAYNIKESCILMFDLTLLCMIVRSRVPELSTWCNMTHLFYIKNMFPYWSEVDKMRQSSHILRSVQHNQTTVHLEYMWSTSMHSYLTPKSAQDIPTTN